jgi:hypothetical protein
VQARAHSLQRFNEGDKYHATDIRSTEFLIFRKPLRKWTVRRAGRSWKIVDFFRDSASKAQQNARGVLNYG